MLFRSTQFHPEFRSRPDRASPPFVSFLDAVMERSDGDSETPTSAESDGTADGTTDDDTETEATI